MSAPRPPRSLRIAATALSRLAGDTLYEFSFIVSGRGTISHVNDSLLRTTFHRAEAVRGKPFSVLVRKTDGKPFGPAFLRPGSRLNPQRKNFSVIARDGRVLPCRGAAYYFDGRGADGGGVLVLGKRVKGASSVRAGSLAGPGNAATILSALRDGLAIIDANGTIVEANAMFAGMTGMHAEDLGGTVLPYPWLGDDDNRRFAETLAAAKSGSSGHLLAVLEREDRPPLALSISISGLPDSAGRFVASVRNVSDVVPASESQMAGKRIERLREQLQRNSVRLKTLQEINNAVLRGGSLSSVFKRITNGVRQVVNHDLAGIYVFDGDEKFLRPHTLSKLTPFSRRLARFPLRPGEGIIGSAAITGGTALVNDAQNDPRSAYPPGMKPPTEHIIAAPLRGRKSTYGILIVSRNRHPGFNEEEALIVKSFADAASIAIDNIVFYAELRDVAGRWRRTASGFRPPIAPGRSPGTPGPGQAPQADAPAALAEGTGAGARARS